MYISKISVTNNFVDSNINFSAKQRVSKNLERFFDFNKERMPVTVRKFIEKDLVEFNITPLQAQRQAYRALYMTDTIDEIKIQFPQEPLF